MEVFQLLPAPLSPFLLLQRSVQPLSCRPKTAVFQEHLFGQHLAPSRCVLLQYYPILRPSRRHGLSPHQRPEEGEALEDTLEKTQMADRTYDC